MQAWADSSAANVYVDWDDDDPSLGVREPRRPRPPSLTGAAAPLHFEPESEAEGIAQGARVNSLAHSAQPSLSILPELVA